MSHGHDSPRRRPRRHAAGLFDIRFIIGALLGIYGIVLVLMGFFGGRGTGAADNHHANLWMGVAFLVASAVFIAWVTLRPVVVDEAELEHQAAQETTDNGRPSSHG